MTVDHENEPTSSDETPEWGRLGGSGWPRRQRFWLRWGARWGCRPLEAIYGQETAALADAAQRKTWSI